VYVTRRARKKSIQTLLKQIRKEEMTTQKKGNVKRPSSYFHFI